MDWYFGQKQWFKVKFNFNDELVPYKCADLYFTRCYLKDWRFMDYWYDFLSHVDSLWWRPLLDVHFQLF